MEDEQTQTTSEMGTRDLTPKTRQEFVLDIFFWVSLFFLLVVYFVQFETLLFKSWDPAGSGYAAAHVGAAGVLMGTWHVRRFRYSPFGWIGGVIIAVIFAFEGWYFGTKALELLFRPSYGTLPDLVIGLTMLLMAYYVSYLYWGLVFPLLGVLFFLYLFVADLLPGPLAGPALDTHNILTREVTRGIRDITDLAARFLWMLVFWGVLLGELGGGVALLGLARRLSYGIPGGPALGSLVSSALAGSFVGGGASNVAITGPVTIPAMRRAGYTGYEAGSVEAMASNASSITPPILGAVAFIMSDLLGVSYIEIIIMSLVPAFLWFLAVAAWIVTHAQTNRHRIRPIPKSAIDMPWHLYLRSAIILVVPVSVIVVLVVQAYTLKEGALWAFALTMVLAVTLRVETRTRVWLNAFRNAVTQASAITVIIVIVALIADALLFTGLGGRLGNLIESIATNAAGFLPLPESLEPDVILLIAAAIMVVAGVVLGGPLPALPVYFIMIVTFAPVLERMGVPTIATHYVAFYMGALGSITLPVAASCLVAAAVANVDYWPTSVVTAKVSWPLWVYPILFALAPELLLQGDSDPAMTWLIIGSAAIVMIGVQSATGGWLVRMIPTPFKAVLYANFALFTAFLLPAEENPFLLLLCVGLVVGVMVLTVLFGKRVASASATELAAEGVGGGQLQPQGEEER